MYSDKRSNWQITQIGESAVFRLDVYTCSIFYFHSEFGALILLKDI